MADFEALSPAEASAFDRLERMRDWTLRFRLLCLSARARIRVARAVASGIEPSSRSRTLKLGSLARRTAAGYERLASLEGAARFTDAQVKRLSALAKVVLR